MMFVHRKHIKPAIEKYGEIERLDLERFAIRSNLNYRVIQFRDNRILLVYNNNEFGMLLKDEDEFFEFIDK